MKLLGYFLCGLFSIAALSADVRPQDASKLKPLPEAASLTETQKWLTDALVKAASYSTGRASVKASNLKFAGCTVSFLTVKQSDWSTTATMGTTKTVTSVKNVVKIDLAQIPPAGIYFSDNLYPHLINIVFNRAGPPAFPNETSKEDVSIVQTAEVVVKKEDAELVRGGFARFAKICNARP